MCEFVEPVRVYLPSERASVGKARDLVSEHVCPLQDEQARERAALLVSELVTNAIKHGGPPIELDVQCNSDHVLEVRVRDAGAGEPTLLSAAPLDEGGRGLALTALLSDDWGVDHDAPVGKAVWFQLKSRR